MAENLIDFEIKANPRSVEFKNDESEIFTQYLCHFKNWTELKYELIKIRAKETQLN